MKLSTRSLPLFVPALLTLCPMLHAGTPSTPSPAGEPDQSSLHDWWNGKGLTGDWFGLRPKVADHGLKFSGKYYGAYFGVVDSQGGARGFYDQGVEFGGTWNMGGLCNIESLEGVKLFGAVRWRQEPEFADPNQFVRASGMFNPSNWISGMQWRALSFGIEVASANWFAAENLLTLRAGWLQPQKEFIDQPLSKLFLNNAVNSAKGIGGNIPFSSSFSTWGGTLNIEPTSWYYAKGGIFMAYPAATDSNNHGLAYQGFAQDPTQNGILAMFESGFTPEIGTDRMPGKYAMGAYYYGQRKNSFNGTSHYGQYGMYWQADQMLFREPTAPTELPADSAKSGEADSAKSFKTPIDPLPSPQLSNQGLSTFNLLTFSPKYNNIYPFYFQSGLVYTGLIPGRDKDLILGSIAYGSYSYYNTLAARSRGSSNQPNYTIFLEGGYRVNINDWLFVQPFVQYVIRPDGTDRVQNATILGLYTGANF